MLAARAGARIVLLEADSAPQGASVRNFGLVTVSGQARGEVWSLSRRSRDLWRQIADEAGLAVLQSGMLIAAQSREAGDLLEAFLAREMGQACTPLSLGQAVSHCPLLRRDVLETAVWSPEELRVEPREVVPQLARHAARLGAVVRFNAPVAAVESGAVHLFNGERVRAGRILVCAGARLRNFAPPELAARLPGVTKLHMLRLKPRTDAGQLAVPAISDLTLARYPGFAELPEAAGLKARIAARQPDMLADGIHIIAVRCADGSVIIGDSHHPCAGDSADPFQPAETDARILKAAGDFLDLDGAQVIERWTGAYPRAEGGDWLIEETQPGVWLAGVLGGKGMTLAFGFAERALARTGLGAGVTA